MCTIFQIFMCSRFLPFEEIVGTILHELVHIVYGPHYGPFKRLLAEITQECEAALLRKLILPSFENCGHVLGGDLDALRTFPKRDLLRYVELHVTKFHFIRFAAESRLALSISTTVCVSESDDDDLVEVIVLE